MRRRLYATPSGYISMIRRPPTRSTTDGFMNSHREATTTTDADATADDDEPSRRMELLSSIHSGNVLQRIAFDGRGGFVLSEDQQPEGSSISSCHTILFDAVCAALLHQSIAIAAPPPLMDDHRWLRMQIRWVLWTIAAYERKYPDLYLGRLLTERSVVECVVWRYRIYKSLPLPLLLAAQVDPTEDEAISVGVGVDVDAKNKKYSSCHAKRAALPGDGLVSASKHHRPAAAAAHELNVVTPNHPAPITDNNDDDAGGDGACGTSGWKPPPPPLPPSGGGRCVVTPMGSHRSAQQHFRRRGAMSPLQRCCDIMCLVWPIVLCVSNSSSSSSSGSSDKQEELSKCMSIELSDGWWWTSAVLDEELSRLLRKVRTMHVGQ